MSCCRLSGRAWGRVLDVNEPEPKRRKVNPMQRLIEPMAKTKAGGWYFLHIANPLDKVLLPLTRGRFSAAGFGIAPVGLLKTIGAKTGEERRTPLTFIADGDRIALIASKAGS